MMGTAGLMRLALRRSRLLAAVWAAVLVAMVYTSAAATADLYPTPAARVAAAQAINDSPSLVALYGPILDVHSLGELAMTKMTVVYAMFLMALPVVLVRRHTRVEEESGRAELVGALAVGRLAPLAAAVGVAGVATSVIAVLVVLANVAGGLPVAGSLWFGASWLGVGLVGAGIGAVAAQVSANARTTGAIAAAVIAVLFLLRAVGDTTEASWLSWVSPLGWATRLEAWSDPRGGVLALYPVAAVILFAASVLLRERRDLDSGLMPERPGRAAGSPRLSGALALTVRTQATGIVVWSVACIVMGALLAAIVPNAGSFLESADARRVIESLGGVGALQETLVAAFASVAAVGISCFAVATVSHAAADEHDGRTEEVLAGATRRAAVILSVAAVALGGVIWLLTLTGLAMAIGASGSEIGFTATLVASLAQIPAVAVIAGLTLLAFSLGGRFAVVGWAVVVGSFVVGPIAELLELPGWVAESSPFAHVPKVPAEAMTWTPVMVLSALAVGLVAVAVWRYRERDVA